VVAAQYLKSRHKGGELHIDFSTDEFGTAGSSGENV
jgi:hypothetical protein